MTKTAITSLLLATLCSACTVAGNWPGAPAPIIPTPTLLAEDAPTPLPQAHLNIPVQIVHVTVRHNGDRLIRLASSGTIDARDGQTAVWYGETVQRNLRAPVQHGVESRHYTVSTDVVRVGEAVAVVWDAGQHVAHIRVKTQGQPRQDVRTLDVPTVADGSGLTERLAVNGPVVVGARVAPSVPASDRREIDVVVVGGPGGSDVDEVLVWNAARRAYAPLPPSKSNAS